MTEFSKILKLLSEYDFISKKESVPVSESLGRTPALTINAEEDRPEFDISSVDGFAVNMKRSSIAKPFRAVGAQKLGNKEPHSPGIQEAVYTVTGARVHPEATHVIPVEFTEARNKLLVFNKLPGTPMIKASGSDICKGDPIIKTGKPLKLKDIEQAVFYGFSEIDVFKKPNAKIISTGDELSSEMIPGTAVAIGAFLEDYCDIVEYETAGDDPELLTEMFSEAATEYDLIFTTGGTGGGKFDFTKKAVTDAGAKEVFSSVSCKPGKTLGMYNLGDTVFFTLPGVPAGALFCLENFCLTALNVMNGYQPGYEQVMSKCFFNISNTNKEERLVPSYTVIRDGIALCMDEEPSGAYLRSIAVIPPYTPIKAGDLIKTVIFRK